MTVAVISTVAEHRGRPPADEALAGSMFEQAGTTSSRTPTRSSHHVWPASPLSTATIASCPVETTVVRTDRAPAALERARTTLATVVILTSLPIAGCSLADSGLVLALLVVASTFPPVERTTGPEVARND